jgi:di/tricarboxylate transporter
LTAPIAVLLAILVVALVLFWRDRVAPDVVALGVLVSLVLCRLLPAEQAFAGFGSETVLMILGLLLLTSALVRTGVVDWAGSLLVGWVGDRPQRLPILIMSTVALLSAFISNTAAAAFFLPLTVGLARSSNVPASRLLMPMAFASILTSSVTLISTSTNLVINGLMMQTGMKPMGLFELAPVGIPIALVGLAYMLTIGMRLLPNRGQEKERDEVYGLRAYLSEVVVLSGSALAGRSLAESGLGRDLELTVLRVVRGGRALDPASTLRLAEGDVLIVEGERDNLLKVKDRAGIDIKADTKPNLRLDAESGEEAEGEEKGTQINVAESIILPRSPLVGRTLKTTRFRERYKLQVMAIHRHGETMHHKLSDLRLAIGDVLLVQGRRESLGFAEQDRAIRVLGAVDTKRPNRGKAPIAVGIFVLALGAATAGLVTLPVAVLTGSLLVFLFRCVAPEEAYRDVEWRALVLIACMLALGRAMDSTGTAAYLADRIVDLTHGASPTLLLTGFFALTVLLTQPMSNQAAAVVVFPIAVRTAINLDLNPRTFAMMIAVAASCSYLTPLEPACLMVYGPGRYRFADFLRVGALLTVLIYVVAIFLVPSIWPLHSG